MRDVEGETMTYVTYEVHVEWKRGSTIRERDGIRFSEAVDVMQSFQKDQSVNRVWITMVKRTETVVREYHAID